MFLTRQKQNFSNVFYQRHRSHLRRVVSRAALFFAISGILAAFFVIAYKSDRVSSIEAAIAVAVFLWVLLGIVLGIPQSFRVRLLPYFERKPGNADAWNSGKSLLENSRKLDDLATALGVTPLSQFASGDDIIAGEKLVWFDPKPALETTTRLLESDAAKDFTQDLRTDLSNIKSALNSATAKNIRFCLLIREGSTTSGAEMDQRKGSFL